MGSECSRLACPVDKDERRRSHDEDQSDTNNIDSDLMLCPTTTRCEECPEADADSPLPLPSFHKPRVETGPLSLLASDASGGDSSASGSMTRVSKGKKHSHSAGSKRVLSPSASAFSTVLRSPSVTSMQQYYERLIGENDAPPAVMVRRGTQGMTMSPVPGLDGDNPFMQRMERDRDNGHMMVAATAMMTGGEDFSYAHYDNCNSDEEEDHRPPPLDMGAVIDDPERVANSLETRKGGSKGGIHLGGSSAFGSPTTTTSNRGRGCSVTFLNSDVVAVTSAESAIILPEDSALPCLASDSWNGSPLLLACRSC